MGQTRSPSATPQYDSELLSPHGERSRLYIEERLVLKMTQKVKRSLRKTRREFDNVLLHAGISIDKLVHVSNHRKRIGSTPET